MRSSPSAMFSYTFCIRSFLRRIKRGSQYTKNPQCETVQINGFFWGGKAFILFDILLLYYIFNVKDTLF